MPLKGPGGTEPRTAQDRTWGKKSKNVNRPRETALIHRTRTNTATRTTDKPQGMQRDRGTPKTGTMNGSHQETENQQEEQTDQEGTKAEQTDREKTQGSQNQRARKQRARGNMKLERILSSGRREPQGPQVTVRPELEEPSVTTRPEPEGTRKG